ncbi:interferon-induced protein 44-like isoform X2 [Halichoeres trimaculatus]|uniref:interferon-induced protein 44-like isoform X2 n=1 Tax=Halichoeres trimaculatus TaxID=147232 RepID=UPI003D9E2D91
MNPSLTRSQQKTICSHLGRVRLQLLYKASVDGFTGAAFHQRCDTRCPTVSVGYNVSGFIFGGYTKQPFSQSGQYVHDDQAFLFTFKKEKLLRYPVTNPTNAIRMVGKSGPYFGEDLALISGSQPVVYNKPGSFYNFNAAEMHGNDLNLTECEVYQVEDTTELENPWRSINWESEKRTELMVKIKTYKPKNSSVSKARVLLIGPIGAGKSTFFNSISSVFRGHVTNRAMAGCSATSITTQDGCEEKSLPIILCDTMGLEESAGAGLNLDDITSIVRGDLPNRYQFNPSAPFNLEAHGYQESPGLGDKIHCVVYVIDACKVSIMPSKLEEKLAAVRKKINLMGIPQLVLLTKVDEACSLVAEDVRNVYKSSYIKQMMQEASARLGVPLCCVIPVKNYSEELEVNLNCDILLLSAVEQMLRCSDDYFEDISERCAPTMMETPWREVEWTEEQKTSLMERVSSYKPSCEEVTQARVLLLGPVGSGKSSFISSVQSVFHGRVTNRAMVGTSSTSFTKKLQSFSILGERGNNPSGLVLCDAMGLGDGETMGLTLHDILSVIKGHAPEGHKFSPDQPVRSETAGFVKRPSLSNKIHCVVFVVDASKILTYPKGLSTTFQQLQGHICDLGVHQVALLTHIDQICSETAKDVTTVYKSGIIQETMVKAGALLGMSTSYIIPVKNYSSELDVDVNTNVLLLSAVDHILQYSDLYFQDNTPQHTLPLA